MQQMYNADIRQPFIDLSTRLARDFLSARKNSSHPMVVVINGHEDSGKELVALSFNAACSGETVVPRDIHADSFLSENNKDQPVVFANMYRREMNDESFALKMRGFRIFHTGRSFIVLSNLLSPSLNSLRNHNTRSLPEAIDAHIEVLKTKGHSGFNDEGPARTLIVNTHNVALG